MAANWSEDDRALLRRLSGYVPSDELIRMLLEFAGELEGQGSAAKAKLLAEVARRLDDLSRQ